MQWNLQIKEENIFADLEYIRELIKSYRILYILYEKEKMKDTFEEKPYKIDVERERENFQKPQQVPF